MKVPIEVPPQAWDITSTYILASNMTVYKTYPRKVSKATTIVFPRLEGPFPLAQNAVIPLIKCQDVFITFSQKEVH